jgi:hypothetical protein
MSAQRTEGPLFRAKRGSASNPDREAGVSVTLSWIVAVLAAHDAPFAHEFVKAQCPRQDSNLRTALRRRVLYPLSYGGSVTGPHGAGHLAC